VDSAAVRVANLASGTVASSKLRMRFSG
jgi:hypothetical protein